MDHLECLVVPPGSLYLDGTSVLVDAPGRGVAVHIDPVLLVLLLLEAGTGCLLSVLHVVLLGNDGAEVDGEWLAWRCIAFLAVLRE